jgi:two-component system, NtrC family, response regulator AtoC
MRACTESTQDTWKLDAVQQPAPPSSLVAVAIAQAAVAYALPSTGLVSIGRGPDVMFQIDDRSISRTHAILQLGPQLAIKDLGSANGVRISGRRIEAHTWEHLELDDQIMLGQATVVLMPQSWLQGTHVSGTTKPEASSAPWRRVVAGPVEETKDLSRPVIADPAMLRLHAMASRAAATDITVLLLGETGTGKEIFAEAIHRSSPRSGKPFYRIHCAAVPETLLESELFGHEKGAFTGATSAKIGLFEAADGGTVFLDEIGDMPLSLQAKLLRVLEDRKVTRLGSVKPKPIDVRFIAATNRNLAHESKAGTFRSDLYYRLNGFCIKIPALRDRQAEIGPLAELFLRSGSAGSHTVPRLTSDALALLQRQRWPGNIRELRNLIARALILANGSEHITSAHLLEGQAADESCLEPRSPSTATADELRGSFAERETIVEALARCGGNQSAAAKLLGVSRKVLIARINAFGLPRPHRCRTHIDQSIGLSA